MNDRVSCELSVVVICLRYTEYFRMALGHLNAQTVAQLLELIVVTTQDRDLKIDPQEIEDLFGYKIVKLNKLESYGDAKAAGVASATASLVAFMEDHSYPDPTWAEAFINAHRKGGFAAVGPIVLNANPSSTVSWGCFLVFYGSWMAPLRQEEVKHLPGSQSCYKRDLLLNYRRSLSDMLEVESVLHWDFLAKGYKLCQEPKAKLYHLNFSLMRPIFSEYYLSSRVFAASRASDFEGLTKVVYALGSPLVPLIRLWRILRDARRGRSDFGIVLRASVPIILTASAGAFGEMIGYILGPGSARERLIGFESFRHRYVTSHDLQEVAGLLPGR